MAKNKYYAVVKGRKPGIYLEWSGSNGAESQIKGFSGAIFKGFVTRQEAETWYTEVSITQTYPPKDVKPEHPASDDRLLPPSKLSEAQDGRIVVYTDGGCIGNPGPGGYGIVILGGGKRLEMSGGFAYTTNNRMELTACIVALQSIQESLPITLYSDSQYVVNGISLNWANKWRINGWRKSNGDKAENQDLWESLLNVCSQHSVEFVWVRGHVGTIENERCDQLSMHAALGRELPIDNGYITR